jgi:hypothetical protein
VRVQVQANSTAQRDLTWLVRAVMEILTGCEGGMGSDVGNGTGGGMVGNYKEDGIGVLGKDG